MKFPEYRELTGIDGEPVESEWNMFPGRTTLKLLREIQKKMTENKIQPEEFRDRFIFMSMHNEIDWTEDRYLETCVSNSFEVKKSLRKHRSFPRTRNRIKMACKAHPKSEGLWNLSADMIILQWEKVNIPFELQVRWTEDS